MRLNAKGGYQKTDEYQMKGLILTFDEMKGGDNSAYPVYREDTA